MFLNVLIQANNAWNYTGQANTFSFSPKYFWNIRLDSSVSFLCQAYHTIRTITHARSCGTLILLFRSTYDLKKGYTQQYINSTCTLRDREEPYCAVAELQLGTGVGKTQKILMVNHCRQLSIVILTRHILHKTPVIFQSGFARDIVDLYMVYLYYSILRFCAFTFSRACCMLACVYPALL